MDPLNSDIQADASIGVRFTYRGRSWWSKLELFLVDVAAAAIMLLGLYVMLGVVTRTFFETAIPDETVIVAEAMIAAVALPLAFVAADRGFITVDIFMSIFAQNAKVNAALNLLGSIVGVIATLLIADAAWESLNDAVKDGDFYFGVLSLPEWPGRGMFFLGYALFIARLLFLCVTDARDVFFGPADQLQYPE